MTSYSVVVKINKRLDKQICRYFINSKIDDFDFGKERIIDLHPELEKIRSKKKKEMNEFINKYVNNYYSDNRLEIVRSKNIISNVWKEIENDYFLEVYKFFNNKVHFKNGNFISYLSISACSPLIEPQGWQIYYKINNKAEIRRIFTHEILHFFYYSYVKNNKQIKSLYEKLKEDDRWTKAELFNVIILNQPQFRKIIGKKEEGYDIHKKYFETFGNIWNRSRNLDEYLVKVANLNLDRIL